MSGWRVKVYSLNEGGQWDDNGTGHIAGAGDSAIDKLVVRSEEDQNPLLLNSVVSPDDIYRRQGDTIISWSEPSSGAEIALSFQEREGCQDTWERLCKAQGRLSSQFHPDGAVSPSTGELTSDVESVLSGVNDTPASVVLPDPSPSEEALALVLERIQRVLSVNKQGLLAALMADGARYVYRVMDMFQPLEDAGTVPALHSLNGIAKQLVHLNDPALIEVLLCDDLFDPFVGCLEYEPDLPYKPEHRKYLREEVVFKQVVPLRSNDIVRRIHQTFRIQILQDMLLPRVLDDLAMTTLHSLVLYNQSQILTLLSEDDEFMPNLVTVLQGEANTLDYGDAERIARLSAPTTPRSAVHDVRMDGDRSPSPTDVSSMSGVGTGGAGDVKRSPASYRAVVGVQAAVVGNSDHTGLGSGGAGASSSDTGVGVLSSASGDHSEGGTGQFVPSAGDASVPSSRASVISARGGYTHETACSRTVITRARQDALSFLQELCTTAKSVQPAVRGAFCRSFSQHSVPFLRVFAEILGDPKASDRELLSTMDIIISLTSWEPSCVRTFIIADKRHPDPPPPAVRALVTTTGNATGPSAWPSNGPADHAVRSSSTAGVSGVGARESGGVTPAGDPRPRADSLAAAAGFARPGSPRPPMPRSPPPASSSPHSHMTVAATKVNGLIHLYPDSSLLFRIVWRLIESADLGVQATAGELLRILLDPDTMATAEKDEFLSLFYDHYVAWLVTPFMAMGGGSAAAGSRRDLCRKESDAGKSVKGHLVDLLGFCVQSHAYRVKYFILRNNLLAKVLRLLSYRDKHLVLSGIRFMRACLAVKDEFYHRYIVKHNLLAPIFDVFTATHGRDNLVNSSVLELVHWIQAENIRSMVVYIVEKFPQLIESVSYVPTFTMLKAKYDQIKAAEARPSGSDSTPSAASTLDTGGSSTGDDVANHTAGSGGMLRASEQRLARADEDDAYFAGDDAEARGADAEHVGTASAAGQEDNSREQADQGDGASRTSGLGSASTSSAEMESEDSDRIIPDKGADESGAHSSVLSSLVGSKRLDDDDDIFVGAGSAGLSARGRGRGVRSVIRGALPGSAVARREQTDKERSAFGVGGSKVAPLSTLRQASVRGRDDVDGDSEGSTIGGDADEPGVADRAQVDSDSDDRMSTSSASKRPRLDSREPSMS